MSPWIELGLSLLLALGVAPAWGALHALERRLGGALEAESRLALSWALALGWAQLGLMGLNFLGLLSPPWVLGWLGIGAALGLRALPGAPRPEAPALLPLLGLLPALGMALVPPWYRDEMTYHLALPRIFALAGGYVPTDDNIFASFPLGWESVLSGLCALGEGGYPVFNPRLLGAWTLGAAALGLVGLARALGAPAGLARAFGAAFLLMPTAVEFGASAYVEPWLALLALTLTRTALLAREREGWSLVAGGLAGLAAGVKYPGLAIGLGGLLLIPRGPRERYLLVLVLVGCPFYLRNLVERGNPFFPLAWELLGGEGWDAWRAYAYRITLQNYGEGRSPLDWLLLIPRLFFSRDLRDGFEGSLGPLGLLGIALGWRRPGVYVFALGLFLFWALTVQQARFALVLVALLLALAASALPARRWLAPAVLGGALLWGAGPVSELWARQRTTEWLLGRVSRDELLTSLLPESYVPTQAMDDLIPADGRVWLVWTRGYTYYLDRPYRLDSVFEAYRLEAMLDEHAHPDALLAALRAEGVTHLLINQRFYLAGTSADLRPGRTELLRQRWQSALDAGVLIPQQRWGPVILYAVQ